MVLLFGVFEGDVFWGRHIEGVKLVWRRAVVSGSAASLCRSTALHPRRLTQVKLSISRAFLTSSHLVGE